MTDATITRAKLHKPIASMIPTCRMMSITSAKARDLLGPSNVIPMANSINNAPQVKQIVKNGTLVTNCIALCMNPAEPNISDLTM